MPARRERLQDTAFGGCTHCRYRFECVIPAARIRDGEISGSKWSVYPKGSLIYLQGERVSHWHLLCEGTVKTMIHCRDGDRFLVRLCTPGNLMTFRTNDHHAATAIAAERCIVRGIPTGEFAGMLTDIPGFALEALRRECGAAAALGHRLLEATKMELRKRVASVLLRLADDLRQRSPPQRSIQIHLSQQDLADMVGASRSRVNQVLKELEALGFVGVASKRVRLVSEAGLRSFL